MISALSYASAPFVLATATSWPLLAHIRPLNHLYEGEGSKVRDEKRVTKRNVATRLGQTDGLGLIEIYSTLGNQELYILPRFCPLFSPRTAFARPIIPNYALLIPDCQR